MLSSRFRFDGSTKVVVLEHGNQINPEHGAAQEGNPCPASREIHARLLAEIGRRMRMPYGASVLPDAAPRVTDLHRTAGFGVCG